MQINGKEIAFRVTLGSLEKLEKRGYSLQQIGEMQNLSASFLLDVTEICCGIPREELEALPLAEVGKLAESVAAALNDSFDTPDTPGDYTGE